MCYCNMVSKPLIIERPTASGSAGDADRQWQSLTLRGAIAAVHFSLVLDPSNTMMRTTVNGSSIIKSSNYR